MLDFWIVERLRQQEQTRPDRPVLEIPMLPELPLPAHRDPPSEDGRDREEDVGERGVAIIEGLW